MSSLPASSPARGSRTRRVKCHRSRETTFFTWSSCRGMSNSSPSQLRMSASCARLSTRYVVESTASSHRGARAHAVSLVFVHIKTYTLFFFAINFAVQGFLFAAEIRHFCWQLQKGNVRAVEALRCPPEAVIVSSPEWQEFVALLDTVSLLHRGFVDRALGQAMGGLMKKKRDADGKLVVKGDITPSKFCDSFR